MKIKARNLLKIFNRRTTTASNEVRLQPENMYAIEIHREDLSTSAPRDKFFEAARQLPPNSRVVEFGTKQAVVGERTHLHSMVPNIPRENYLMVDIEDGYDVDFVADLHALPNDWTGRYHAVIAPAVFEHLERPWIAAREIARILAPSGICYISTHQTFPLHGYPSDFFRFSKEALSLIFNDAELHVSEVGYRHRTDILPPSTVMSAETAKSWNELFSSYLIVDAYLVKGNP